MFARESSAGQEERAVHGLACWPVELGGGAAAGQLGAERGEEEWAGVEQAAAP
jgi:hypothetical protein